MLKILPIIAVIASTQAQPFNIKTTGAALRTADTEPDKLVLRGTRLSEKHAVYHPPAMLYYCRHPE